MNNAPDWVYISRTACGEIRFPDGRTVFMQGEEASEFDDKVEACETDEQITNLLMEYEHIAEWPEGKEPEPEETITRTFREINNLGIWTDFCWKMGLDPYFINEGKGDLDETTEIPISIAKELGLVKEGYPYN